MNNDERGQQRWLVVREIERSWFYSEVRRKVRWYSSDKSLIITRRNRLSRMGL